MPNPLSVTEGPKPSPLCIQYERQHGPDSNQRSDYTRIKNSKRLGDPLYERVTVSVHKFNVIKLTAFSFESLETIAMHDCFIQFFSVKLVQLAQFNKISYAC